MAKDMRWRWQNLGIVAGLLLAVGLAIAPVKTWYEARAAQKAFDAAVDIEEKARALRALARSRVRAADATVRACLGSSDAAIRTHAAYAIRYADREDLADDLRSAWQREVDPACRGAMLFDWGLLAGPDVQPLLQAMLASQDPWTVLAAARVQLRWGVRQAAGPLFVLAVSPNAALRGVAQEELRYMLVPLATMIGQILPVPDVGPAAWSDEQVSVLKAWWEGCVTPRLLQDYASWRFDRPDAWNKANMLLHTWKSRVSGVLVASEGDGE